jgi:hypothetical protein
MSICVFLLFNARSPTESVYIHLTKTPTSQADVSTHSLEHMFTDSVRRDPFE